jgi:hypothetical protein
MYNRTCNYLADPLPFRKNKPMRYLSLLALLMLSACAIPHPISKVPAENNKDYNVEYLFEHEGCKVYRFLDHNKTGSYYVYFTNCNGTAVARTDSTAVSNNTSVTRPGK